MSETGIGGLQAAYAAETPAAPGDTPEKIRDAAQQFEALLLAQVLRAASTGEKGLFGGGDSAGGCATDYATEQFAVALAQRGGLGLADMIAAGLKRER